MARNERKLLADTLSLVDSSQVKENSFKIILAGKTGVGKSHLVNALMGEKVAKEGHELDPCTYRVQKYTADIRGVKLTVWDTPGLQDGKHDDAVYLASMRQAIKEADLLLYCIAMDNTRLREDERNAIKAISSIDNGRIWSKALFALTFSNFVLNFNGEVDYKLFVEKRDLWKNAVEEFLKNESFCSEIPFIPIGHMQKRELPTTSDWISDFWVAAYGRSDPNARINLLTINQDRVTFADKTSQATACRYGASSYPKTRPCDISESSSASCRERRGGLSLSSDTSEGSSTYGNRRRAISPSSDSDCAFCRIKGNPCSFCTIGKTTKLMPSTKKSPENTKHRYHSLISRETESLHRPGPSHPYGRSDPNARTNLLTINQDRVTFTDTTSQATACRYGASYSYPNTRPCDISESSSASCRERRGGRFLSSDTSEGSSTYGNRRRMISPSSHSDSGCVFCKIKGKPCTIGKTSKLGPSPKKLPENTMDRYDFLISKETESLQRFEAGQRLSYERKPTNYDSSQTILGKYTPSFKLPKINNNDCSPRYTLNKPILKFTGNVDKQYIPKATNIESEKCANNDYSVPIVISNIKKKSFWESTKEAVCKVCKVIGTVARYAEPVASIISAIVGFIALFL